MEADLGLYTQKLQKQTSLMVKLVRFNGHLKLQIHLL